MLIREMKCDLDSPRRFVGCPMLLFLNLPDLD